MKAKEKADELINKFYKPQRNAHAMEMFIFAKECALICAEEILSTNSDESIYGKAFSDYWIKVKNEINKL